METFEKHGMRSMQIEKFVDFYFMVAKLLILELVLELLIRKYNVYKIFSPKIIFWIQNIIN